MKKSKIEKMSKRNVVRFPRGEVERKRVIRNYSAPKEHEGVGKACNEVTNEFNMLQSIQEKCREMNKVIDKSKRAEETRYPANYLKRDETRMKPSMHWVSNKKKAELIKWMDGLAVIDPVAYVENMLAKEE